MLALLLWGCGVHSGTREPALPFPPPPALTFACTRGVCCLSEADANLLARWMHKLLDQPDGFVAARERLLKGP